VQADQPKAVAGHREETDRMPLEHRDVLMQFPVTVGLLVGLHHPGQIDRLVITVCHSRYTCRREQVNGLPGNPIGWNPRDERHIKPRVAVTSIDMMPTELSHPLVPENGREGVHRCSRGHLGEHENVRINRLGHRRDPFKVPLPCRREAKPGQATPLSGNRQDFGVEAGDAQRRPLAGLVVTGRLGCCSSWQQQNQRGNHHRALRLPPPVRSTALTITHLHRYSSHVHWGCGPDAGSQPLFFCSPPRAATSLFRSTEAA